MNHDKRRQTMIEPNQIGGENHTHGHGERRKTIIEDETPQEPRMLFGSERPPETKSGLPPTERFGPQTRAPMAKLFVLDDSGVDAEVIRIRSDTFRIGRELGDLVLNHDGQMSGEHAEIRREYKDGVWSWYVVDLDSTNGVFVRVTEVPLEDDLEVWIGGRLYRFELGGTRPNDTLMPRDTIQPGGTIQRGGTLVTASGKAEGVASASLVEVAGDGIGARYELHQEGQWIGRDPDRCQIVIDDSMLGTKDTYAFLDEAGNWGLRRGKSLNGIWARVRVVPLIGLGMQFQCGEQRFALRVD